MMFSYTGNVDKYKVCQPALRRVHELPFLPLNLNKRSYQFSKIDHIILQSIHRCMIIRHYILAPLFRAGL